MSSSEKFTFKGTFRQVFICQRSLPSYDPHTTPYTLYTCIQHTYPHREGGGGANQREVYSSQSWIENTIWLTVYPVYKLCRKDPLEIIFIDDDILLRCPYEMLSCYRHLFTASNMCITLGKKESQAKPKPILHRRWNNVCYFAQCIIHRLLSMSSFLQKAVWFSFPDHVTSSQHNSVLHDVRTRKS